MISWFQVIFLWQSDLDRRQFLTFINRLRACPEAETVGIFLQLAKRKPKFVSWQFLFCKLTSALEEICTLQLVRMSDVSLSLIALWEKEQFLYNKLLTRKTLQCLYFSQVCQVFTWEKFCRQCFREIPFRSLVKTRQIICIWALAIREMEKLPK